MPEKENPSPEQDLTAHVDFTTLREAGEAMGLKTVTLTRQAAALLDPDGMGEEICILVQAKGVEPEEVLDLEVLGA